MNPRILRVGLLTTAIAISVAIYLYLDGRQETDKQALLTTATLSAVMPSHADGTRQPTVREAGSSTSIREADVFTLAGSNDYSALKAHFLAAAEAGDPYARRVIAQIYDYCFAYSASPANFDQGLDALATINPKAKSQLADIRAITDKRCANLDGGELITLELMDLSWGEAMRSRDPLATVRAAERQKDLNGPHLDQLLNHLLPTADPETLFEVGQLLETNRNSVKYAAFSDPNLGRYAWQIVACRRGGATMCGPRSPLMMTLCMNGICSEGTGYEQMVRTVVPVPDRAKLDSEIAALELFLSQQVPSP